MTGTIIWDPNERLLWGIAITILFVGAVFYFYRGKQNENKNARILMYGLAALFFCLALGRICFFLSDLQVRGIYKNDKFYGDFNNYNTHYEILVILAYSFDFIGVTIFCLAFEIIIRRTKYILTMINLVILISILILPFKIAQLMSYIGTNISIILFYLILFYFSKHSRLEVKVVSSFMLFGGTILFIGIALYGDLMKETNIFPLFIAPVFYILGAIIALIPTLVDLNSLRKASSYLLIIMIVVISTVGFLVFSAFYYGLTTFIVIVGLGIMAFLFYVFYNTMKILKYKLISERDNGDVRKSKKEQQDFLAMFVKPQKLTEEEVTFHKEKKICLVCKGKLSRLLYMCPECDALYCIKCSDALSDLENACWVCETAFDESKPVGFPERIEHDKIEEKKKK